MNNPAVTVRIPCSTSNLGSGFDTLGLALNLYNEVTVSRVSKGEQPPAQTQAETTMIEEAAALFFGTAKKKRFPFAVGSSNEIPIGRGLGASATLRVSVLAALNELADRPLAFDAILQLGTELEGHPDNVSPELFGGFTVSGKVDGKVHCLKFTVSKKLEVIALIPDYQINTEHVRTLLPGQYSRADTSHALNRAALITAAFASERYESLHGLFDDRLHQPFRAPLVPELRKVIQAGEKAGAIGGFLSGSGSAIICLTLRDGAKIAQAMQKKLMPSKIFRLRVDNEGCRIL